MVAKFEEQAGFPEPGFADQEDHLPVARANLGKGIRQELQLATTPDERCQPSFGLDFQPCAGFLSRQDFPRLYRCLLALQGQWPEGAAGTIARNQSVGGLRHNDLPWGSGVLETGRHVQVSPTAV